MCCRAVLGLFSLLRLVVFGKRRASLLPRQYNIFRDEQPSQQIYKSTDPALRCRSTESVLKNKSTESVLRDKSTESVLRDRSLVPDTTASVSMESLALTDDSSTFHRTSSWDFTDEEIVFVLDHEKFTQYYSDDNVRR